MASASATATTSPRSSTSWRGWRNTRSRRQEQRVGLRRPSPTQRQPTQDLVEWARKETIAFLSWKWKVYGVAFVAGCAFTVPFLSGMPAHRYWQWIGTPVLLATTFSGAALIHYAGCLVGELLYRPDPK